MGAAARPRIGASRAGRDKFLANLRRLLGVGRGVRGGNDRGHSADSVVIGRLVGQMSGTPAGLRLGGAEKAISGGVSGMMRSGHPASSAPLRCSPIAGHHRLQAWFRRGYTLCAKTSLIHQPRKRLPIGPADQGRELRRHQATRARSALPVGNFDHALGARRRGNAALQEHAGGTPVYSGGVTQISTLAARCRRRRQDRASALAFHACLRLAPTGRQADDQEAGSPPRRERPTDRCRAMPGRQAPAPKECAPASAMRWRWIDQMHFGAGIIRPDGQPCHPAPPRVGALDRCRFPIGGGRRFGDTGRNPGAAYQSACCDVPPRTSQKH